MKTLEVKKKEAEERAGSTSYKAPEKPCTSCKYHTNNPSFCNRKDLYVGRKGTCEYFKCL